MFPRWKRKEKLVVVVLLRTPPWRPKHNTNFSHSECVINSLLFAEGGSSQHLKEILGGVW